MIQEVRDLERARTFYEGLGWYAREDENDDVVFFQASGMVVALWDGEPGETFRGGYSCSVKVVGGPADLEPAGRPPPTATRASLGRSRGAS